MSAREKLLVAVSGGVDSVVLLDVLVKQNESELIVAHFDHGIREDSADDARFVEGLAKKYALPFFAAREELGTSASEERARMRRYDFLRRLANKHGATIITAHHADDLVETIAINIQRGTGWRGVAVLGASDVRRPLLGWNKSKIYSYALEQRLEWVEDSTNATPVYLRNRIRGRIAMNLSDGEKQKLVRLWQQQTEAKTAIEKELERVTASVSLSRYFLTMVDMSVAVELLQYSIQAHTGASLLFPQLERGVLAIRTALPGTIVQLGAGIELSFSREDFIARKSEKML